MVGTQFQNLSESDNTGAIISFALGTIFMILWFVDRYLRSGSAMGQGLYDLAFRAYLVKYVPTEEEGSAFGHALRTWGTLATSW